MKQTDEKFESKVICYRRFQESDLGNRYRFKVLKKICQLPIPDELCDQVDEVTFKTIETNRIPLFLGSQFGIHPRIHDLFNDAQLVASCVTKNSSSAEPTR